MSWKNVVSIRTKAEKLQKKSVEDFNRAAARGDDEGRKKAQQLGKDADTLFKIAAAAAAEEHRKQ